MKIEQTTSWQPGTFTPTTLAIHKNVEYIYIYIYNVSVSRKNQKQPAQIVIAIITVIYLNRCLGMTIVG